MSDPEVLRVLRLWLRHAQEDLRTAELLAEEGGVPRNSCFYAQQAAEKSIKATFVFLQVDFPFTHNLDRLSDFLPEGWTVKEALPDLADLSNWAVEPRYPGDAVEATEEDAEIAIEQAREVLEVTIQDLRGRGYPAPNDEGDEQETGKRIDPLENVFIRRSAK